MCPNLEAEMLNMTPTTLGNKLNGKVDISLPECIAIKKILNLTVPVDELFKSES